MLADALRRLPGDLSESDTNRQMTDFRYYIYQEDCLEVLRRAPDTYFDSMVTDPPAGIGFMGREWDSDKGGRVSWVGWMTEVMQECYRVLKPGAHALVWAIPRTSHWTATALEDAGFEVRDIITHHFGSGFPKSQDVGKFIDKAAGAERVEIGRRKEGSGWKAQDKFNAELGFRPNTYLQDRTEVVYTAPSTDAAKQWDGWGTALKPATEHWILVRKPLSETSIARNVLKWGTGALNIDACRVNRDAADVPGWHKTGANGSKGYQGEETFKIREMSAEEVQERCGDKGRWPTNLLLSHSPECDESTCVETCPVAELDRQSGQTRSTAALRRNSAEAHNRTNSMGKSSGDWVSGGYSDSGGASRFFPTFRYQAKPSRSERERGLDALPESTLNRVNPGGLENEPRFAPIRVKNNHPTCKGIELMRWLIRLITPLEGLILDPFCGSGTTGCAAMLEGCRFIGIDESEEYCRIAQARIEYWAKESDSGIERTKK